MRWRARSDRLIIRQLGSDEYFVYDVESANTHLVHPVVASVLQVLIRQSLTLPELYNEIQNDHHSNTEVASVDLQDVILSLESLFLIESTH